MARDDAVAERLRRLEHDVVAARRVMQDERRLARARRVDRLLHRLASHPVPLARALEDAVEPVRVRGAEADGLQRRDHAGSVGRLGGEPQRPPLVRVSAAAATRDGVGQQGVVRPVRVDARPGLADRGRAALEHLVDRPAVLRADAAERERPALRPRQVRGRVQRGDLDRDGLCLGRGHRVLGGGEAVDVERRGHALGEQPIEVGRDARVAQRRLADDHQRPAREAVHVVVDDAGQQEPAARVDDLVGDVVVRRVGVEHFRDQVVLDQHGRPLAQRRAGSVDHGGVEDQRPHGWRRCIRLDTVRRLSRVVLDTTSR